MALMVCPEFGLAVRPRSFSITCQPRRAGRPRWAPPASSKIAVRRAGTKLTTSSKMAAAFPRYSYLPRYPIMLSSVFSARYATAPGTPKRANANHGATKLSVLFSATDSIAEAATRGTPKEFGSLLTRLLRLARACPRLSSSNALWVVSAATERPRTVNVVRNRTVAPAIYARVPIVDRRATSSQVSAVEIPTTKRTTRQPYRNDASGDLGASRSIAVTHRPIQTTGWNCRGGSGKSRSSTTARRSAAAFGATRSSHIAATASQTSRHIAEVSFRM